MKHHMAGIVTQAAFWVCVVYGVWKGNEVLQFVLASYIIFLAFFAIVGVTVYFTQKYRPTPKYSNTFGDIMWNSALKLSSLTVASVLIAEGSIWTIFGGFLMFNVIFFTYIQLKAQQEVA